MKWFRPLRLQQPQQGLLQVVVQSVTSVGIVIQEVVGFVEIMEENATLPIDVEL